MHYSYKIYKKGKIIDKCSTKFLRRYLKKLRSIKYLKSSNITVKIRFNYGHGFVNEGEYSTKHDLWLAVNAFREVIDD